MPNAKTNKLYRTFVKGLVTEASPLTFPPDSSYDEDNCLIFQAGNRARRLGMEYETGYQLSSHTLTMADAVSAPMTEYVWRNVNNVEGLDFLCHQVKDIIYFYNCSGSPTSTNKKSFVVNLSSWYINGHPDPTHAPVQMISGKGYLFIVSDSTQPIVVEYNENTDEITIAGINILIRDFDGIEDGLAVDEEITTLSNAHQYNLFNQGWTGQTTTTSTSFGLFGNGRFGVRTTTSTADVIQKYKDVIGRYPGNNKQWFLGKVEAEADGYKVGDFNPLILNKIHVGNTRAPRGHFIYDAFNKDRAAVSGIAGLPLYSTVTRPCSIAFAAGRVFYAHENNVYFSQVLSDKGKAGLCFQDNDPTAEDISDLLDNDGGVIPIPSADKIVHIKDVANGVMAFANNGVWFISGAERGFSATDYQVTKVSSIGTESPLSIVDTENHIYWWSKTGIQRIEQAGGMFGPVSGSFTSTNLTESTIDTYLKNISSTIRKRVKGAYDHGTNTIYWLYSDNDLGYEYFYNNLINYNIAVEAFYPWSLSAGTAPLITGLYITSDINRITNSEAVTVDGTIVTASGATVTAEGTTLSAKDTFIQFIVAEPDLPTNPLYQFTIGGFTNDNFVDWESFNGTGFTYNSFIESGFEILEDAARTKSTTYIQPFFRQTEENFVAVGDDYTLDKPSSCYLTTKWDWSDSSASNKWATKTQVYRLRRVPYPNPLDLSLNTGFKVVSTRNRVRGQGQALQFRFECDEIGKNFDLLGWQVFYTGNTEP